MQIYTSLLALVTVVGNAKWSRISATHAALVLLAPWVLYAYRDLWPLCTFTVVPVDAAEGAMMWARVALLTLAAVVVPLFGPRQFIPIDPEVRDPFYLTSLQWLMEAYRMSRRRFR